MKELRISVSDRARAMVHARLRTTQDEGEAMIVDAHARGLCVMMPNPPDSGEIVEVLVGQQSLVGQVRWRLGRRCGISLAEPICVIALLEGGAVPIVMSATAAAACEQRRPLVAALASDGPLPGRILQAALILLAVIGAVMLVGKIADRGMEPLDSARIAMAAESDLAH